jgi:hypothetical protein
MAVNNQTNIVFRKTIAGTDTIVTLGITAEEETLVKTLTIISPASSKNTQESGSGPKDTKLIDLLRVKAGFEISGFLFEGPHSNDIAGGVGTLTDTSSTAKDRKTNLKAIINAGQTFTMYYDDDTYVVNCEKYGFKRVFKETALVDGDAGYDVKLSLVIGVDL